MIFRATLLCSLWYSENRCARYAIQCLPLSPLRVCIFIIGNKISTRIRDLHYEVLQHIPNDDNETLPLFSLDLIIM